ncbi:hypothetical protein D1872_286970 [compost metagenome]
MKPNTMTSKLIWDKSRFSSDRIGRLCGSATLMAITAAKMKIWNSPIRNMPMIFPNICASGDTLVIRISMMRELFSAVTSAAIILPVIIIVMKKRMTKTYTIT